jgi:uncharacterized protein YndB with AHSA1/START domain
VFKAWTDPDQVAKWWSPEGFDVPRESVDLDARAGGRFDLVMVQLSDGAEFPLRSQIAELVEPELIVLNHEPLPEVGLPDATITRIEFEDDGGKTRMSLTSGPYTEDMAGNAEAGWKEQFGKLDRLLAAGG